MSAPGAMLDGMAWGQQESRFVGRSSELSALREEGHQAQEVEARATLLVGEAGVGKSRLVREYLEQSRRGRTAVGSCPALGSDGLPFAPFVTVLRQLVRELDLLGTTGAADSAVGNSAVDNTATPPIRELSRLLPELGEPPQHHTDQRTILFAEIRALLERAAAPNGLVVVLEDLHWADSSTRELLVFLLHNLTDLPIHLLATCRSDDLHREHPMRRLLGELERLPGVRRLELDPLGRDEVAAQAADLQGTPLEQEQLELVVARSGGNPLFVESFLEHGFLDHGTDHAAEIPAGPRELLLGPLRTLDDTTRRVVRAAAVGGDWVEHHLLATVVDLSEDQLDEALDAAVGANVLRVHGVGYSFRHALLAEAVRSALLPGERVRLHRKFADALDAGATGLTARHVAAEVAHHRYAAHDLPGALAAAWQAAQTAGEALAYPERSRMLERVLELWEQVPDAAERTGMRHVEAVLHTARAAIRTGNPVRGADLAQAGIDELTDGMVTEIEVEHARDDAVCLARLLHARGEANKDRARDRAVADLRQALRALPMDHPDRTRFLATLTTDLMLRRDATEAMAVGQKALEQARTSQDHRSEAEVLAVLGRVYGIDMQQPQEGLELLRRSRALARQYSCPVTELQAIHYTGVVLRLNARAPEALEVYWEGVRRERELGLPEEQILGVVVALFDEGRLAEVEEYAQQAARTVRIPRQLGILAVIRALTAHQRGELDTARTHLQGSATSLPDHTTLPILVRQRAVSRVLVDLAQERLTAARATVQELVDGPLLEQDILHFWDVVEVGTEVWRRAWCTGQAKAGADAAAWDALYERLHELCVQYPATEGEGGVVLQSKLGAEAFLCLDQAEARERFDRLAMLLEERRRPVMRAKVLLAGAECCYALHDVAGAEQRVAAAAEIAEATGAHLVDQEIRALRRRAGHGPQPEAPDPLPLGLTRRETEVLRMLGAGWSNPQIAAQLSIAVKTVSVHVSNLLAKLGVSNRNAAAVTARELGLEPVDYPAPAVGAQSVGR